MPSFDAGQTGITPGVTILTTAGAVHTARATAGITEPVTGSGVYHFAHPDPGTLLLFVFDVGVGKVGASVWDDGLTTIPARAGDAMTLTAAYDHAKDDVLTPLAVVDGVLDDLAAAAYSSGVEIAAASLINIYEQTRSAIESYDPPKKSELDAAVAPLSTAANLAALDAKVVTVDAKVDTVDGILDTTLPQVLAGIVDAVDGIAVDYAKTGEAALAVATLNDFDPATDVVAHVTLVDTTTTNTDMRGTDSAMLAASYTAPLDAEATQTAAEAAIVAQGVAGIVRYWDGTEWRYR